MTLTLFATTCRTKAEALKRRAEHSSYTATNENGLSGVVRSPEAVQDRKRAALLEGMADIAEGRA